MSGPDKSNLNLKKLIVKILKLYEKNIRINVGLYDSKRLFLHRTKAKIYTGVAQLVEHWSPKPGVGSSSLSSRAVF